jgi:hypothetical protein
VNKNYNWTEYRGFDSEEEIASLKKYAKGSYQKSVLQGTEPYSGSTLRGSAKNWSGKYRTSYTGLLVRIRKAGYWAKVSQRAHNKGVLVIVKPTAEMLLDDNVLIEMGFLQT